MNWLCLISALIPVFFTAILTLLSFTIDLNALLTLFVPVVWSILFTLGGGVVFMRNAKSAQDWQTRSDSEFSEGFTSVSIVLIIETALFLLLSTLYPARQFLIIGLSKVTILHNLIPNLICFYKSLLFSLIVVPSISSLFVGLWILYLVLNSKE